MTTSSTLSARSTRFCGSKFADDNMQCDVLSLDLDGTLIDYSVSTVRALEGIGGSAADLRWWHKVSADSETAVEQGRLSIDEFEHDRVRAFYDQCIGRQLTDDELDDLVAVRRSCVLKHVRLYPDAMHFLEITKILGLRCVCLSNSYTELRDTIIRQLDVSKYFTDIIFCGSREFRKPDQRAFAEVERAIDSRTQEIVHIGDEVATDVVGAKNSGWQTVHVNRSGDSCSHEGLCVTSLDVTFQKYQGGTVLSFHSEVALNFEDQNLELRADHCGDTNLDRQL